MGDCKCRTHCHKGYVDMGTYYIVYLICDYCGKYLDMWKEKK